MGESYYGIQTKSGSLYLLKYDTEIIAISDWSIYVYGEWFHVIALVSYEFISLNNIKNPQEFVDEQLLAKAANSGAAILAKDIKRARQFVNKVPICKQGATWFKTSTIQNFLEFM